MSALADDGDAGDATNLQFGSGQSLEIATARVQDWSRARFNAREPTLIGLLVRFACLTMPTASGGGREPCWNPVPYEP